MNLKNDRGYVITDVSISIIILLILVPVITAMVYKVNTIKRATESKAEAINILVNTLEAAKGIGITDLVDTEENETTDLGEKKITTAEEKIFGKLDTDIYKAENNNGKISFKENEENEENNTKSAIIETDKAKYMLLVEITDFAVSNDAPPDVETGVVKTVKATVNYKVNGNDKEIDLSTVIK